MAPALLALVLGVVGGGPYMQVSARDATGADSPVLAAAISRALVVTCATVVVGPESLERCGARCVRLLVIEESPLRFRLEARQGRHAATSWLELPVMATQFEQARAIAVEARLLVSWDPDDVRPAHPVVLASLGGEPIIPAEEPGPPQGLAPAPADPPAAQPASEQRHPIVAGGPARPVVVVPGAPVARQPDTLGLDVSATALGGNGGFLTWGFVLAPRLALGTAMEVQLALGLLGGQKGEDSQGRYRQRPHPFGLTLNARLPWVRGLSIGAGGELVAVEFDRLDDQPDRRHGEPPASLTPGVVMRVEYRKEVRWFSLVGAAYGAYHPFDLRDASVEGPVFAYPAWTFGISLGLGFGIL